MKTCGDSVVLEFQNALNLCSPYRGFLKTGDPQNHRLLIFLSLFLSIIVITSIVYICATNIDYL